MHVVLTKEDIDNQNSEGFKAFVEYVNKITASNEPYRHEYYRETVEHAEKMGVHVLGKSPEKLLKEKRPNETEEQKDYRLKVWKPITKSLSSKIINTTARIFNPKFFRVEFPEDPRTLDENETLSYYLFNEFGVYRSLWIYIRETFLKMDYADPNGAIVVMPQYFPESDLEMVEPLPIFYPSENLVDFKDGEYYTFFKPSIMNGQKVNNQGHILIVDDMYIRKWYKGPKELVLEYEVEHGFEEPPCFRVGGEVEGKHEPYFYSSFISGVQPHWDKVVTWTSDLDAGLVTSVFMEAWEYQDKCATCRGAGKVTIERNLGAAKGESVEVDCRTCSGQGWVTNRSPLGMFVVKQPDALNPDQNIPVPPKGYIDKNLDPIRELKACIVEEKRAGFESVNLENLFEIGNNQSGIAKEIDRQDMDAFFMRIANHIFDYVVPNIIKYVALWRYKTLIPNINQYIDDIVISKPKEFNVLSIDALMNELKVASNSNVSSNYLRQIEKEVINNKFSNDEFERKKNLAIINLKPFPGKTIDELLAAKAGKAIREKDFIRNQNIDELVAIAVEDNMDFLDMSIREQKEVLNTIIEEQYMDRDDDEGENNTQMVPVQQEEIEEEEEVIEQVPGTANG